MSCIDELSLIHYCHPDCEPLRNIMRLPREEAFELARRMALAHPGVTAFGRFADFVHYYPNRLHADELLRERFLAMGGKPSQEHPLSFVVEGSEYLCRWFDGGPALSVPLNALPSEAVSFTYGDSAAVLQRGQQLILLTKEQLAEAARAHGGTMDQWLTELRSRWTYIEAQVWQDECVYAALRRANSSGVS